MSVSYKGKYKMQNKYNSYYKMRCHMNMYNNNNE